MKKKYAEYLKKLNMDLTTENKVLRRLLESKQNTRYGRCYFYFQYIAKARGFGDDYFGSLIVKQKTMKTFGVKSMKSLSDTRLRRFETFLAWLHTTSASKIDYDLFLEAEKKRLK